MYIIFLHLPNGRPCHLCLMVMRYYDTSRKIHTHLAEWADSTLWFSLFIGVTGGNTLDKRQRLWNWWERHSPPNGSKKKRLSLNSGNPKTFSYKETLTLRAPSHFGRSNGQCLCLTTPITSCFPPPVPPPPPRGAASSQFCPSSPAEKEKEQFLRLRSASLGASTRPPPARGPFVRLRACSPALSLRSAESVSLSESVLGAEGSQRL